MSKTIDERVVEMRLENSNFEKNAATSIGTLAKLKQSLNLTGASKGLEQVNAAAGKVDMRGLAAGVDTVTARFSALQVMGVTALANITNQAVNAGKKMVSALTIDPIMSGFSEYETKMGSIQTILANTQHEGTNLDQVTAALDDLNTYADKTIYNFQEMTRNIGTFTAAGVDLNTSVESIKGIANLAAVSGSTSQQASTAMYQLSQALAAGKVSLMDWNSVVNAGMGGKVFQDALIRTSELLKTGAKEAINTYGSFRESLTQGEWLTTEVLTETLKQLSGAYSEADLIAQGFTESQAKEIVALADTASDAATKVKTFTQLFDTLKESAQSGWAQTWELMFGDFEEAKEFFTGLSESIGGFIESMSEYRNKLIGGVFNSNWDKLTSKINDAGIETSKFEEKIRSVAEANGITSKEFDKLIEKHGSLAKAVKAGAISSDILKKALSALGLTSSESDGKLSGFIDKLDKIKQILGFGSIGDDVKTLQTALEKLGYSVGECKIDGIIGPDTTKAIKEFQEAAGLAVDGIAGPDTLEALKKAGTNIEEVSEKTKDASVSYDELVDNITKKGGRELFLEGFGNVVKGLVGVFKSIGSAWASAFPATGIQKGLLNAIEAFNKFSKSLLLTEETLDENGETIVKFNEKGEKLVRTFKGVFAVVGMVSDVVGGGLKLAFKAVKAILGYFDLDLLDVTASIGDALVKFREMTDVSKLFSKAIEFIAPILSKVASSVKEWARAFKNLPWVQKAISKIKEAFASLKNMDFKEFGKNIIDGLKNGLGEGGKEIIDKIISVAKDLITNFCEILGIHSPSTKFFEFGKNIVQGLVNGIQNGISWVGDTIKSLATTCVEFFKGIDWGAMFAIGVSAGMIFFIKKMADAFETLSGPIDAITEVLENCADVVKNVSKVVKNFAKLEKAVAFNIRMDGIQKLAIAVAILAGSVIAISFVDIPKLWNAVGVIFVLSAILFGLALAMEKLSKASLSVDKNGVKLGGVKTGLLTIGASLLLIAATVKLIGSMDPDQANQGFIGLAKILGGVLVLFLAYGLLAKNGGTANLDKVGGVLLKISASMILLVFVAKMIAGMTWPELGKAAAGMAGLVAVIALIATIGMIPGKNLKRLGDTLLKISGAFALLVIVAKMIAGMTWADMGKAAVGIFGLVYVIAALTLITMIPGVNTDKLGSTLLGIAGAMAILLLVAKMVAGMSWKEMGRAAVGMLGLTAIVSALITVVRLCGKDAPKIAGTLLALSVSIGILAGVAIVLSLISIEGLIKGVAAVAILSTFMALMISATRGASECKGNLIVMAVAIGVMAASVAALSLIDTTKLASATIALSAVMGAFALMIKMGSNMKSSIGNLIVMTVAIGVIAGMLYLLASLPIESSLAASAALSMLLLSLSASMAIMSSLGAISIMGLVTAAVIVGVLAEILLKLQQLPVESTLGTALALSALILALSGACALLAVAGAFGFLALAGIVTLVALIATMGVLCYKIGELANENPLLEQFVSVSIPLLQKIGEGLGSFFGGIVKGFGSAVLELLPVLGEQLTAFMGSIQGFIAGASAITPDVLVGIGVLAASIVLLSAANLIQGITSIIAGGFASLGLELSLFMLAAQPFLTLIRTVDPTSVEAAKSLAQMILILTAANFIDGIASFITGGSSFADFGAQLVPFGLALVAFSDTVKGKIDETAVTAAANAGKIMAEMASSLPNSGGVLGFFAGENDMITFGAQLVPFGQALVAFSAIVKGKIDQDAVEAAAKAGSTMVALAKTIPNTGGVLAFFAGDNDMATFGVQLVSFGSAIVAFSAIVKGNIDQDAVEAASKAGATMVELANTIPNTGGLISFLNGDNDMATFGAQIVLFGKAIKNYSKSVKDIDTDSISSSVTAAAELVKLQNSLDKTGGLLSIFNGDSGLDDFGKNLKKFGKAMAEYSTSVKGVNSTALNVTTKSFETLLKMAKSAENVDFEGIDSFGKSLKKLGKSGVEKFVKAFTDGEKIVKEAGKSLIDKAIDGIEAKEDAFEKATKKVVGSGANAAKEKKSSFESAGKDLGSGLVKGINSKKQAAYDAGYALGQKAVQGEKDGQASNSPSKLTILAGKWLGEGLVLGIGRMTNAVYNAGYDLGDSATESISSAIARIGDAISSDVEAEPTIRPVLDLSDISSGVNTLNGMLDMNRSIGLMSNVGAVSALANSRQNGTDEVVYAINKLNKSLSNLPTGTTNNINGITYSHETEISDAIGVLVRATVMEGRV